MNKLVKMLWAEFCQDEKVDPSPAIGTRIIRKVMSCFRSKGAPRQLQEGLAVHMAHNITTADKQYDLELGIQQSADATAYI